MKTKKCIWKILKYKKNALKEYLELIKNIKKLPRYTKIGQGLYPHNLIHRLKLLGGSIMARNNSVVLEFTQIARYLNSIKVLPKKELDKMIKTMKIYLGIK